MAENKTVANKLSVDSFLNAIADEGIRNDCKTISKMMSDISGEPAVMWGTAIIGFGSYHYKYESGREGDSCIIGFSPRKQNLTLYVMGVLDKEEALLAKLGKYKTSKGCLYIKRLADVDMNVLKELVTSSFQYVKEKHKA